MTKYKDKLVTYHLNTFNRISYLKNLFKSFYLCNVHENFEWVVTDYGSTDGTRDYLSDMAKQHNNFSLIFNNENTYFEKLRKLNLMPQARHQIIAAIFGKAMNEARTIANGEYYIHVADDHQFIRKADWFGDMMSVFDHRNQIVGKDDISSILYRSLPLYRIHKKNNETFSEQVTDQGLSYFVAKHKHYDDYHLMKKKTYNSIGKFFEIHNEHRKEILDMWANCDTVYNHYIDYLDRSKKLSYSKVIMKLPYAVDLDGASVSLNQDPKELVVPIVDNSQFENFYRNMERPVSSNEVITFCKGYQEMGRV